MSSPIRPAPILPDGAAARELAASLSPEDLDACIYPETAKGKKV